MCRRWRSFKTLQNAQVTVIRAWLTNYRRKSIDKRKELEAALKEHKDKKPKAKAVSARFLPWVASFSKDPSSNRADRARRSRWTPCGSSWRR